MNSLRILLLSNTRPSRSLRFALRVTREVPDAQVCGIVQRPVALLSPEQRALANAAGDSIDAGSGLFSGVRQTTRKWFDFLMHTVLWCVHGCPRSLNAAPAFGMEHLADKCAACGWPLLEAANLDDPTVSQFIDYLNPDLTIVLGEASSLPQTGVSPARGWIRCRSNDVVGRNSSCAAGLHIRVEYLPSGSGQAQDLVCLTLPRQTQDSRIGLALKSDLIADDLLTEATAGIQAAPPVQAARRLAGWVHETLSPYLLQAGPSTSVTVSQGRRWFRSISSLTVETVLLCSPVIVLRNWIRRFRGRYPVLILVHHLVSDRVHRMSISTECFWRQLLFLRRHYRIVSLSEAAELLGSGSCPSPVVSITFDDGYADNFVSLRAVSEELGVPVALFITTMPVELHHEFYHDVIREQHGAFPMNWAQIRYWKDRGAEIGSHTRTHIRCGLADRATLQQEIVGSKADFQARLGEAPRFFAFPFGTREDMPPAAMTVAASAYSHFLSACGGENFAGESHGNTHLFRKNAYPEPWELELELQSVFDFVEFTKRRLRLFRRGNRKRFGFPDAAINASPGTSLPFQPTPNQFLSEATHAVQPVTKNT